MGVNIHPNAIVDPSAELGENVVVEAFAMVGKNVKIGDECHIFIMLRWRGELA